ncbi:MAG: hypothetical protein IPI81_16705 [Flavobacteriales bacterium]|nr:hypothetical protein [Flavobacteriales bacterium]MCC6939439.1 hypothetical protein [Flavobacteriales bacterium]
MIATLFGRKRITEDKLANVFVNTMLEMCAEGFPVVLAEVNEAPEFELSPGIRDGDDDHFLMIVLAANLMEMERTMGAGVDKRIFSLSVSKFSQAINRNCTDVELEVRALQSRMERLNFPSKNPVYAMGRAIFQEYDLFCYQDSYYREMRAPQPIVLKRLNGLMGYFLWNWPEVNEQYRIA